MSASIRTPGDIINLALAKIGFKQSIGSLYDGSVAAKKALDIYAQTRDAVLRAANWNFAERIITASLSGQAAPSPWRVSYAYPADCLKVRGMFDAAYVVDPNNPLPILYTVANDSIVGRVILSNTSGLRLVYTAQIFDPAQWEPLFIEALAAQLGERLALVLTGAEAEKVLAEEEKTLVPIATETIG